MLRLVVLSLLLANAGYFAWTQGFLAEWGAAPPRQSEPQRMGQQIRPEAVRIAAADEARRIEATPAVREPECLLAGPLDEAEAQAVRTVLEAWPGGSWAFESAAQPGRWIVYMGKYLTPENVARKKGELRQIGVSFEPLSNPELELGLSLGGFSSPAAANRHLEALVERGVRTARVVQERPEQRGQLLRLPALDDTLRPRLDEIRPVLGAKPLRACR